MRARPFRRPAKRKISRGPVSQLPPASRPVRLLHPCSGLAEMPCPRARCGYGLARHSWRCDAPNDKTTRRRCWSRHLGLHHCHRSMLRLPRGSPSHATSQGRSSTWTSPSFRGCSRPLPSRSIAANKALPRLLDAGRRIPARDTFAPDSPLEGSGFEPSVPLAVKTLLGHTFRTKIWQPVCAIAPSPCSGCASNFRLSP